MSWVKLDDNAPDHPKLIGLDDATFRLWIGGLCYCARHGTDGLIPAEALPKLAPPRKAIALANALVRAGLWHPRGEHDCVPGSYEVHDFLEYHPTAEASRARRQMRAEAGRMGGIRSGQVRSKLEASASHVASTMSNPARALPGPARPDPLPQHSSPPTPQGVLRAGGGIPEAEKGAGPGPEGAPPPGPAAPDLVALAQQLEAEGSGLGASVCQRIAQGRSVTPGQRAALARIAAERAESGKPLPLPAGTPKPKARGPTRAEVERMLLEAENDRSTMSPANGAR
jgi:hypothetical protein